jgi:pimeloyl-ACP methyl ester carboxylesterase
MEVTMRSLKTVILFCFFILIFLNTAVRADERVCLTQVRLRTADGILLDGMLHRPLTDPKTVGVVLIHGYSGNFYSGVMGFLPSALAAKGFTSLAINTRDHDRGPKKNRFEENRYDIEAAVSEMARLGYHPIFLYGHSMGTNRVLYYLASTKDPRIHGVMLSGPPGNLFEWNIRIFGIKAATGVLSKAQNWVAKDKGDEWMLINLGPLGKALYSANHVVSLRGPKTLSDPYKNIAGISRPILIVHGLEDHLADPKVADRLRNRSKPSTKVTVVKIAGANHRFRNHKKELVNTIYQWIISQDR